MSRGRWRAPAPDRSPWLALATFGLLAAACSSPGSPPGTGEGSGAGPTAEAAPDDRTARAEAVLADLATAGATCAGAVAVTGEVVFAGAGELGGASMTPDTPVEVGDIAASFTAAATLVLEERGVLSLDDSVLTWIPEGPEAWATVTVADLLHHTSGLPPYDAGTEDDGVDEAGTTPTTGVAATTTAEALALLVARPDLRFDPGTAWAASPSDGVVLELVMARATGEDVADIVTEVVLEPVGLVDTEAHAGVTTTVRSTTLDLLRWAVEWDTGAALGDDVRRALLTPTVLDDGSATPHGAGLDLWDEDGVRWAGAATPDGAADAVSVVVSPDESIAAVIACPGADVSLTSSMDELVSLWQS